MIYKEQLPVLAAAAKTKMSQVQTFLEDILSKADNFFILLDESRQRNPCLQQVKLFTDLFHVVEETRQLKNNKQTIVFKLINDLLAFFSSYTCDEVNTLVDSVIKADGVHPDDIQKEDLDKFKRYIWYFLQVGLRLRKHVELN